MMKTFLFLAGCLHVMKLTVYHIRSKFLRWIMTCVGWSANFQDVTSISQALTTKKKDLDWFFTKKYSVKCFSTTLNKLLRNKKYWILNSQVNTTSSGKINFININLNWCKEGSCENTTSAVMVEISYWSTKNYTTNCWRKAQSIWQVILITRDQCCNEHCTVFELTMVHHVLTKGKKSPI